MLKVLEVVGSLLYEIFSLIIAMIAALYVCRL